MADSKGFYQEHEKIVQSFVMIFLSVLAVLTVKMVPVSLNDLLNLDLSVFLTWRSFFLVFMVLPVVYSSFVSLKGFNNAVFSSFLGLSGVLIGFLPGVVGAANFLSCLIVSYTSGRNFTGENELSVFYGAGGVFATLLAVMIAFSFAYTVSFSDENSKIFRSSVVEKVSEQAEVVANRTVSGLVEARKEEAVGLAKVVGRSSSALTISETRKIVFRRMEGSGEFGSDQVSVVSRAFVNASRSVPGKVAENVSTTFAERYEEESVLQGLNGTVEPAVKGAVSPVFERRNLLFGGVFLVVFSLTLLLRLPLKMFSMLFGKLFLEVTRLK